MKKPMKESMTALSLPIVAALGLMSASAHADVIPGCYEGTFPHSKLNAKVFVYQSPQSKKKGYAFIFSTNEYGVPFGSYFAISEVAPGMQFWNSQFRDGNGSFVNYPGNYPTYQGAFVKMKDHD